MQAEDSLDLLQRNNLTYTPHCYTAPKSHQTFLATYSMPGTRVLTSGSSKLLDTPVTQMPHCTLGTDGEIEAQGKAVVFSGSPTVGVGES